MPINPDPPYPRALIETGVLTPNEVRRSAGMSCGWAVESRVCDFLLGVDGDRRFFPLPHTLACAACGAPVHPHEQACTYCKTVPAR